MSYVTGVLIIDAPASALNNAGADKQASTDNGVEVKFIRTPAGHYPYVSAQAFRYWLRTSLAQEAGWSASPLLREAKIAYTEADPTLYDDDDLFGYMRAPARSSEKAKTFTRIAPFRVGTMVSTTPVRITSDFGTMARVEGDPVPHEHQFYRAHLKGPFSIDLSCAGTFFDSLRVGYKNVDSARIENAKKAGATEAEIRGFKAWRLPIEKRRERVAKLVSAIGRVEGGAKQTLHLTDTAPSLLVFAVCKNGNQPFMRLFTEGDSDSTVFRPDVLEEACRVFKDDIQSTVYIGWAKGFLDSERKKLEAFLEDRAKHHGVRLQVGHPREAAEAFAKALMNPEHEAWFD